MDVSAPQRTGTADRCAFSGVWRHSHAEHQGSEDSPYGDDWVRIVRGLYRRVDLGLSAAANRRPDRSEKPGGSLSRLLGSYSDADGRRLAVLDASSGRPEDAMETRLDLGGTGSGSGIGNDLVAGAGSA